MRCWLAVAAAEHVRFGRSSGFVQVCHGEEAPLALVQPGDRIVCYSPTARFRGADRLQAFTAIGIVKAGACYRVDMGAGFRPHRRDVNWLNSDEAPIRPLLDRLALTRGRANWGHRLRRGFCEISRDDMAIVAAAMRANMSFPNNPLRRFSRREIPRPGADQLGRESVFR